VHDVDQRGVRISVEEVDDWGLLRGGRDGLRSRFRIDHEHEEVRPDRARTEPASLVELCGDDLRRVAGHRYHPQTSGIGHGRRQAGARTTADRRLLDRNRATDEFREACAEHLWLPSLDTRFARRLVLIHYPNVVFLLGEEDPH
jgi:hypothetical protein